MLLELELNRVNRVCKMSPIGSGKEYILKIERSAAHGNFVIFPLRNKINAILVNYSQLF